MILSSGAIGSPRLLQLSVIGPSDELRSLGIDPILDSPEVGENLQDHLDLYCITELNGPYSRSLYQTPLGGPGWTAVFVDAQGACGVPPYLKRAGFGMQIEAYDPPIYSLHLAWARALRRALRPCPRGVSPLIPVICGPDPAERLKLASADHCGCAPD